MIHKTITFPDQEYPIMILDINKDNAYSPMDYGKLKAGLTLGVGITREVADKAPPTNYKDALQHNVYDRAFFPTKNGYRQFPYITEDGMHVLSPYKFCNDKQTQNWKQTQMRSALQEMFSATEIADLIVPVEKITAEGVVKPAYNYMPRIYTEDKVFLPRYSPK